MLLQRCGQAEIRLADLATRQFHLILSSILNEFAQQLRKLCLWQAHRRRTVELKRFRPPA